MHRQKKRRKHSLEGLIAVDGIRLSWRLLSEPQWTSEHGYKGLCISVRMEAGQHRELVVEYPFPKKCRPNGMRQLPQRPKFSEKAVEAGVRQAMAAGWEPDSRGKIFVFILPEISN
jgi:hypothetical protein